MSLIRTPFTTCVVLAWFVSPVVTAFGQAPAAPTKPPSRRPDYPPFAKVAEGYKKVASTMDGKPGLYTLWTREKDGQMLAELPRSYATDKYFFAMTVSSGETDAGYQQAERYLTWRRYDKRLALVEPNTQIRSTGEKESRDSVKRLFTDRVVLDVPIVCLGPAKTPVIDMDALLVGQASKFFPFSGRGANPRLTKIKTAKSFPKNVEISFEAPVIGGRLKTLHYSISKIQPTPGYKPRVADERIGYFTTSYTDLGKYKDDETRVRYINRWHLEKADPSLKLSPPKQPIVFYIEHTTPKRYRYWVKRGLEVWNKAFEKIGLRDAIVVYQQDSNPAIFPNHMEKDPEDVRYNFIRWLNNDIATAIGPSRVDPLTGQILDADIILTDGWIRSFGVDYDDLLPKVAMEGFSPQTLAWLNRHPNWDPRVILAPVSERQRLIVERHQAALLPHGGHPMANLKSDALGDDEFDGLVNRQSQQNGLCLAADGNRLDLALMRMTFDILAQEDDDQEEEEQEEEGKGEEDGEGDEDEENKSKDSDDGENDDTDASVSGKDDETDKQKQDDEAKEDTDETKQDSDAKKAKKPKQDEGQKLDGVPEEFIGPLISWLVSHEVGHTLGLRHNFKGSAVYSLDQVANGETSGPHAGSVMDYLPINMRLKDGEIQGDHAMKDIGPYDMWAIEYGYSFAKNLKPILQRVAEPELAYATDEDTWGPDPRARRWDFSKDPLDFANDQMALAKYHRENLLEKFVKDGESWAKAREGYNMSLSLQTRSLSMISNWIGGTLINRDKKGDKNGRDPLLVVDAERQREALDWVMANAFRDESFGLSPKLIRHLTVDQWLDDRFIEDVDFPVHDRIMGIQGSILTMLMKPYTLRLVYDNELRTPEDEDVLTLPELLGKISDAIWSELEAAPSEKKTVRKPWLSSLRRNLQAEHLERLVDLTLPSAGFSAAYKPISNLAVHRLRKIHDQIDEILKTPGNLDEYSSAHLVESKTRIAKALEAEYIYNTDAMGGGGGFGFIILGAENQQKN